MFGTSVYTVGHTTFYSCWKWALETYGKDYDGPSRTSLGSLGPFATPCARQAQNRRNIKLEVIWLRILGGFDKGKKINK